MNTKQKLTLGIAAIFMVTLTIVGVTYAYFVTQVTGTTVESVQIKTASLGVSYSEGNAAFNLTDVLPKQKAYKTFSVVNSDSTSPVTFSVGYEVKLPAADSVKFISATDPEPCYAADAVDKRATLTDCYSADTYNNVKISFYEYTGNSDITTMSQEQIATAVASSTQVGTTQNVIKATGTTYTAVQKLVNQTIDGKVDTNDDDVIDANDDDVVKNYIVVVEYVDAEANQNIETTAALTFRMNIALPIGE